MRERIRIHREPPEALYYPTSFGENLWLEISKHTMNRWFRILYEHQELQRTLKALYEKEANRCNT